MTLYRAPLRVSFFGGGTDLPEFYAQFGFGRVLNVAIDRYAYARVMPVSLPYRASIFSSNRNEATLDSDDYLMRVLNRAVNAPLQAFVSVDAPERSGLGGSSAASVALVASYYHSFGLLDAPELNRSTIAEAAYRGEVENNSARIGKQDQYAAAFGGLNLLEFSADGTVVEPLYRQIPKQNRWLLERSLLLVRLPQRSKPAGRVLTKLTSSIGNHDPTVIDNLTWSIGAATTGVLMLVAGQFRDFGLLLNEAWERKQELGYSTYEAARTITEARHAGAIAGKECGTGGHVLIMIDPDRGDHAIESVVKRLGDVLNLHAEPIRFDYDGLRKMLTTGAK